MCVKGGSFLTLKLRTQIRYKYPRDKVLKVLKVRKKVLAKAVLTVFFFFLHVIVKSAWNKPAYFAEKLQLAMKVKLQRNSWNLNLINFVSFRICLLSGPRTKGAGNLLYFWRFSNESLSGLKCVHQGFRLLVGKLISLSNSRYH